MVHPSRVAARNLTLGAMTPAAAPQPELRDEDFTTIMRGGLPHYLHVPSGWSRPLIRGGATDEGEGGEGEGEGEEGEEGGEDEAAKAAAAAKAKAKADKDKAAAEKAGKKQAEKDLAEQLGVSIAEAKKIIAGHKTAQDETKSEAEKQLEAAKAERAGLAKDRADARTERIEAKVERKLAKAGVDDKALTAAVGLVKLDPELDMEDVDDAIDEAIESLQEIMPGLFDDTEGEAEPEPKKPGAPGRTDAKPPKGGQKAKTALERGRERARHNKPAASDADPFATLRSA